MTEKTGYKAKKTAPPDSDSIPESDRQSSGKANGPLKDKNTARITASSIAISWSIILLVLLIFFNKFIAYYQPESMDDVTRWVRYPILTEAFFSWLPIVIATLALYIAGHIILIYRENYVLQETILGILNLFAIAAIISLILIFPFDFSGLPSVDTAMTGILYLFVRVGLIGIAVIFAVGALVRFIRLIINLALHRV